MKQIFILSLLLISLKPSAQDTYWIKPIDLFYNIDLKDFHVLGDSVIEFYLEFDSVYSMYFRNDVRYRINFDGEVIDSFITPVEDNFSLNRIYRGKIDTNHTTYFYETRNQVFDFHGYAKKITTVVENSTLDTVFQFIDEQNLGEIFYYPREFFKLNDTFYWIGDKITYRKNTDSFANFCVGYYDFELAKIVEFEGPPRKDNTVLTFGIKDSNTFFAFSGVPELIGSFYTLNKYPTTYEEFKLNAKLYYTYEWNQDNRTLNWVLKKIPDPELGYIGTGTYKSFVITGSGHAAWYHYPLVARFDKNLKILWEKRFPYTSSKLFDFDFLNDSTFIAVGSIVTLNHPDTTFNTQESLAWILKMDIDSDTSWNRFYKNSVYDSYAVEFFKYIEKVKDTLFIGGYYLATNGLQFYKPLIAKLNLEGCVGDYCGKYVDPIKLIPVQNTNLKKIESLKIYPNPSSSIMYTSIPSDFLGFTTDFNIVIKNIEGKTFEIPINIHSEKIEFNISSLAAGNYIIEIFSSKKSYTGSFLKIH